MSEAPNHDYIKTAQAAADQLDAVMRDLFLPAAVRIEKRVKSLGGSRKLATRIAADYVDGLLRSAGFGRRNEDRSHE